MLGLLRWLIGSFITLIVIVFAILNRQNVDLIVHPLHDPYTLPLYLLVLGMMGFGFMIGAAMVWLNDGKWRRECRKQKKTIQSLEKSLESSAESNITTSRANELFPALTHKKTN